MEERPKRKMPKPVAWICALGIVLGPAAVIGFVAGPRQNEETVRYFNPATGHYAQYTLPVTRTIGGKVIRIDFENGGYLDSDDWVRINKRDDGTMVYVEDGGRLWMFER